MNKGTYVGVTFTPESTKKLRKLTTELKVPNVVPRDKLHSTILYSKKKIDIELGITPVDYMCWAEHLEIWKDDNKNILVLKIGSLEMKTRNDELMKLGATSDYPEFNQHITLSYNIGDWKIPESITPIEFNLFTSSEYVEDLVLDWN